MIFQEPMTALNPLRTIGDQIGEMFAIHTGLSKAEINARVLALLEDVRISDPKAAAKAYPHELSGGQRQRAMIAMALALDPKLLIADEPTSALDVTVQQVILDQIDEMTRELGSSVLLITHDLGLAAERAQQLVVMHRGRVVESGDARAILEDPQHAYTRSLVAAAPSVAEPITPPSSATVKRASSPSSPG